MEASQLPIRAVMRPSEGDGRSRPRHKIGRRLGGSYVIRAAQALMRARRQLSSRSPDCSAGPNGYPAGSDSVSPAGGWSAVGRI